MNMYSVEGGKVFKHNGNVQVSVASFDDPKHAEAWKEILELVDCIIDAAKEESRREAE
jgi:hypothetical protein